MSKKYTDVDELFSVNQSAVDEFIKCQFQQWEELSKLQREFANLWMECVNAQMQRITSARNLNDICAAEAGLTTEYSMKFADNIRKVFETLLNAQKEFVKSVSTPDVLLSQKPQARHGKPGKSGTIEVGRQTAAT